MNRTFLPAGFALLLLFLFSTPTVFAQKRKAIPVPAPDPVYPESLYNALEWRCIGPFRGGRSAAVTGVPGKPNLFYFGSTGGGVWRTSDGGRTWENISDGFFGGSVGAIEVAPSDHNVLYAGGGEVTVRGNVSYGSGLWKSEDAGQTWKFAGLKNSRHVPRIRVHPGNPDLVYAAVLGDLFRSSDERGIYRSKDGGKTWERILFVNADAGAVDLCMDPTNPRILYASTWRIRRTPYSLSSGGAGSGLWKSTDSGDTWTEITRNEGLPQKDTIGIIGVTVSPANPKRVWAIVEAENGGVFRSDDGGKKWQKLNDDRNLRQRAWYYTRIYADSKDEDKVYVVNVAYHVSKDGGKTFTTKRAPHGDHHDLWIAPEDSRRMIIGDDGGAQISYDGGDTWSTYHNQPTAQFYRVTTDNTFPYRIYAAQQDNSTVRIAHRTSGASIDERDWEPTAGGESGHIAVDPNNPEIVYGGSYHGYLTRVDHQRKSERTINVWPEDNMGHGAEDAKYRFQWNFPLFFSPHDPKKLYAASNHLHVSTNEGQSWQTISPDLTTNDKERQQSSGGPITQDNTSVEYYCTIFAACESPYEPGLLWTGSDDGLVQVSRDGGASWTNVTPAEMPQWCMVNSVEPDPFRKGGLYVAATSYKSGDYSPYLFHTADYGKSWRRIVNGIDPEHFTRVLRADPKRLGLLYCGTEAGMYISFDDGANWQPFQLNLPVVPITDLALKNDNLIAATQGRSLWMIDDLTVLHQLDETIGSKDFHLFQPMPAYRMDGRQARNLKTAGTNHPGGVLVHFYLQAAPGEKDTVQLSILNVAGDTVRTFSNQSKTDKLPELKAGGNRFVWNLRYAGAEKFDGLILWSSRLNGPRAVPGAYQVRLTVNGQSITQSFEVLADPRATIRQQDFQRQFDFVKACSDKLSDMHRAIKHIRMVRTQMTNLKKRLPEADNLKPLREQMGTLDSMMTAVEKTLYQTKNRSGQDPLNFPVQLNDKLGNLMEIAGNGDFPPTDQDMEVQKMLFGLIDAELEKWQSIRDTQLPELNRLIRELQVDVIRVE
ncbi:MAG: glycosyl hydrolase [Bacteroidetes bacterium]|nr:MAG: glycosyl hydrolase [Bacteroidota bacterium]